MKKNQATKAQIQEAQAAHPTLDHKGLSKALSLYVSESAWRRVRLALPSDLKQARQEALARRRYEASKKRKILDLLDKHPGITAREASKRLGDQVSLSAIGRAMQARSGKTRAAAAAAKPKAVKDTALGIFQTLYSKRAQFQHEQLATVSEIVSALNKFAGTRLEVVYLTHPLPTLEIRNNQSR